MKQKDLLELFISGSVIHENVSVIDVDEDLTTKHTVGAVDGADVPFGTYMAYWTPIEKSYEEYVTPDYTLHDEDGREIYLLRIDEEPQKNPTTSFFYYMWNRWSEEECHEVFRDGDYRHLWNKWCQAYDELGGPRGAAEYFYMMLSDTNRDKLTARACELYDGMSEKH